MELRCCPIGRRACHWKNPRAEPKRTLTQEDPIGLAGGTNLYQYVGNDPVGFTDPFGLMACDPPDDPKCPRPGEPGFVEALEPAGLLDPVALLTAGVAGKVTAGIRILSSRIAGAAVSDAALVARAEAIEGALPTATQRFTTTAVARATAANGRSSVIVASSERVLRPAQRAVLAAGEMAVSGAGHAEMTVLRAAQQMGVAVDAIAVSRPICADCARALTGAGVRILTPLK